MTFLAPVPIADAVEAEIWGTYVQECTRLFFDKNARAASFDGVCFMLIPKPVALPMLAIEDSYDDIESLIDRTAGAVDGLDETGIRFRQNSCGQVVIVWPFSIIDDDHKEKILRLLRETARDLKAVATAFVSECWLRTDLNAPRGTGSDVLMSCCEQIGRDVVVSIAEIEGDMPTRSLGPWVNLDGIAMGNAVLRAFDDEEIDSPEARGFTPKVNVSTIGEA